MKLDRAALLKRVRLIAIAWVGVSVFFTAVLMVSDLGGRKPLGFALYANAVHFGLWTALLPIIWHSAVLFPVGGRKNVWNGIALLIIVAVMAALVAFVHWAIVYETYFPYRSIYPSFRALLQSELVRFMPVDTLIGIILVVALSGWRAWQALQEARARASDLERQLALARLQALRMQLHPHFLFNTLHTVAGLTIEEPATAQRMVIALGDLLRSALEDTGDQMRTLAEELACSDLYLGIEKLRLGNRLLLQYDIDPPAARALVPQLLLQPLFENAIRHGAARLTGPCEVRFCASCRGDEVHIMIRNDGPRRPGAASPPRFGVGLKNTLDRLRIYYGDGYRFSFLDRAEGGAQIEMSIPYRDTPDEESSISPGTAPPARSLRTERMGGSRAGCDPWVRALP
jgi:hypothetical protein